MGKIKYNTSNSGAIITIYVESIAVNPIEDIKKAIKILSREVVRYENGISPDIHG